MIKTQFVKYILYIVILLLIVLFISSFFGFKLSCPKYVSAMSIDKFSSICIRIGFTEYKRSNINLEFNRSN